MYVEINDAGCNSAEEMAEGPDQAEENTRSGNPEEHLEAEVEQSERGWVVVAVSIDIEEYSEEGLPDTE